VQAALAAPLRDAEAALSVAQEMDRLVLADKMEMAEATVERLNRDAVNAAAKAAKLDATAADKKAAADAADAAKADMRKIKVPVIPRLLAQDASPAALKDLLAEHNGRIAIISAEGGLFDMVAARYGRESVDIYTEGHSGDAVWIDRHGQPPGVGGGWRLRLGPGPDGLLFENRPLFGVHAAAADQQSQQCTHYADDHGDLEDLAVHSGEGMPVEGGLGPDSLRKAGVGRNLRRQFRDQLRQAVKAPRAQCGDPDQHAGHSRHHHRR